MAARVETTSRASAVAVPLQEEPLDRGHSADPQESGPAVRSEVPGALSGEVPSAISSEVSNSVQTIVMPVLGMSCAACQHSVESALTSVPGVRSARVDLMRHRALVAFDPTLAEPQRLAEAVRASGYDAVLPRAESASTDAVVPQNEKDTRAGWKAAATIAAGGFAMLAGNRGCSFPAGTRVFLVLGNNGIRRADSARGSTAS